MTPILFEKNETNFSTFGIGALADVTSCVCTEERNGLYECIFTYPITGKYYEEIQAERIIKAKAKPLGDDQLFRIYRMSKPIHGIVTVYAQHISYDLSGVPVTPFSADLTPTTAMTRLFTGTDFVGHSDISGTKTFGPATPHSARAMLGGTEGSILDLWGGEYKWDNFDVYLNTHRGLDKQVVIEYGKNLTDLVADHDLSEVYSELLPYATYNDENGSHTVTGSTIPITSVITRQKTLIKDFTTSFDDVMTPAQVTAAAQAWLNDNPLGYETPSLSVSFIDLPHDVNYPAAAATIDLCDTVTIRYTALGVDVKAKVIACEYDTLLERYTTLTIGKARASMTDTVASLTEVAQKTSEYPAMWKTAIEVATEMITGNAGGYVVLHEGQDGKPYELLVMDDEDITQATKVWRWTQGGLGYSTNGYAGPYELAITADGKINADFIRAGRLLVSDAQNNALFDANIATNSVQIAGFNVMRLASGSEMLTRVTRRESVLYPGYTDEEVIEITSADPQGIYLRSKIWRNTGSGIYEGRNSQQINKDGFVVRSDQTGNPSGTGREIMQRMWSDGYAAESRDANSNLLSYIGLWPNAQNKLIIRNATNGREVTLNEDAIVFTKAGSTERTTISRSEITLEDARGNEVTIIPIGPGIGEGNSAIDASVQSGSVETIASFSIDPGTYLVTATARFESNATGIRQFAVTSNNSTTTNLNRELTAFSAATPGNIRTTLNVCGFLEVSATMTIKLNVYQNSGSTLGVVWSWHYVRLV